MSFIHNRIGLVAVGVLMMLVLVGAGCGSRETTGADGKTSAVPGGATTTADDDAGAPTGTGASVTPDGGAITNWAEYRSESLGITIPYPEGWYVEESESRTRFHSNPAPQGDSEYPAEMWITRESGTIADAIDGLTIISSGRVERSGINMQRFIFREPFYEPPEVLLYVWEGDGYTMEIGGPNHAVVERAVTSLTTHER